MTAVVRPTTYPQIFDPRAYGRLGTANDTVTFDAAITAANAAGGGVVPVPWGTWLITQLIMKSNVILQGSGWGSVLRVKDNANSSCSSALVMGGANYATVRDLCIDGNKANQVDPDEPYYWGYGIAGAAPDALIERCWVHDTMRSGIYAQGDRYSVFYNRVEDCGKLPMGEPLVGQSGIVCGGGGLYNKVIGNHVLNVLEHGIKLYADTNHCVVVDNVIDAPACSPGIVVDNCDYGTVRGNKIVAPDGTGIEISSDDASTTGGGHSIGNIVTENAVVGAGHHGINLWTKSGTNNQDNRVSQNIVTGSFHSGITLVGALRTNVGGNACSANATDATGDTNQAGILLEDSPNSVVIGNTCHNNGNVANGTGILTIGTNSHSIITGNRCFKDGSGYQPFGIRTAAADDYMTIVGNDCTGSSGGGVYTAGAPAHNVVVNNIGVADGDSPTRTSGVTSVANAGTITHHLLVAPSRYGVTSTVAKHIVSATPGATTLTIALYDNAGAAITAAENVAWWAEV